MSWLARAGVSHSVSAAAARRVPQARPQDFSLLHTQPHILALSFPLTCVFLRACVQVGVFTYIYMRIISVYNKLTIRLCPKKHLHKNTFLNFSGWTTKLITKFPNFQCSVRSDWEHVSLCRDRGTEVAALAPYSDISVAFFVLNKSDFPKRLAEQERFSYTEVMYYANIFLG